MLDLATVELTVEKMLVFLLIVKVTTVLLDLVNTKLGGIDLLGAEVVVLELAANLAVLLAILLDPEGLNVGTLDDVVPVSVGSAVDLLGLSKDLLLESLNSVRSKKCDFVPDSRGAWSTRSRRGQQEA
jgi:hypothetical protein